MNQNESMYRDGDRVVGSVAAEREALTDELLQIGRELADLPDDGEFGTKIDLRERQKELRQRLAELEDVVDLEDETDDLLLEEEVLDLTREDVEDVAQRAQMHRS